MFQPQRLLWAWLLCFLQFFAIHTRAQEAVLDAASVSDPSISLTRYFSVLEDSSRQLQLQDVLSSDVAGRFKSGIPPAEAIGFGFTNSIYWFRLTLRNSSNQPLQRMLEISNARLTGITLYQPDGRGGYQTIATGMAQPFDSRPYPNRYFVFPVELSAHSEQVVYLQVQTSVPLVIPAKLWQTQAYLAFEHRDYIAQSMYFGLILAMVLFNLLLFVSLRDSLFVYYVLFVVSNSLSIACMNGLAKEWFWPQATTWAETSTYFFYITSSFIGILFIRRMLNWQVLYPRFDRLMLAIAAIFLVFAMGFLLGFTNLTRPTALLIGVGALLILSVVLHAVWHKQRVAKLFLVAFLVYIVGILAIVLRGEGFLPTNFFTVYGLQIGSALEVVLLAFALADRFNEIRTQNARVQAQAIRAENEALLAQANADNARVHAEAQQAQNQALQVQAELARKDAELAQKESDYTKEQLQQADKMASLGQLVASVTHEINTPIGAITSSGQSITEALSDVVQQLPPLLQQLDIATSNLLVELLQQASLPKSPMSSREERAIIKKVTEQIEVTGLDQARQKAGFLVSFNVHSDIEKYLPLLQHPRAEDIQQAARNLNAAMGGAKNVNLAVERVAKIVKALKSFSHFNIGTEKIEADLTECVETVLTIYQGQTKVGVEVVRNYENLPPLWCFPDELNQVWTNLIHNALQAMNHEGTLTIGIRKEGNNALVSVGDSGCGIPEEIRGKIFDVFFTTKPAGVGSGLGLDIVKKIIQKHHGHIDLQSQVGVGTTFTVTLPYGLEVG